MSDEQIEELMKQEPLKPLPTEGPAFEELTFAEQLRVALEEMERRAEAAEAKLEGALKAAKIMGWR